MPDTDRLPPASLQTRLKTFTTTDVKYQCVSSRRLPKKRVRFRNLTYPRRRRLLFQIAHVRGDYLLLFVHRFFPPLATFPNRKTLLASIRSYGIHTNFRSSHAFLFFRRTVEFPSVRLLPPTPICTRVYRNGIAFLQDVFVSTAFEQVFFSFHLTHTRF